MERMWKEAVEVYMMWQEGLELCAELFTEIGVWPEVGDIRRGR
jgi:hypothetical protein